LPWLINSKDFDMNSISVFLTHLRPVRVMLSTLLAAVLFLTSGFPALAAKSAPTKGTVQLDKIEQKTQEAIDTPAQSLKTITERAQEGLNEVQGNADYDKMKNSNDSTLPVVKQAEKAMQKIKKG
jgi:hypothetical protein